MTTGTATTFDSSSEIRPVAAGLVGVAPGIELYHEVFEPPAWGPPGTAGPKGETILLIMGLGTQLIGWPLGMIEQLVDAGFRVVRYDNRDVGLSSHSAGDPPNPLRLLARAGIGLDASRLAPYALTDLADDAVGLLDHLGVTTAHVVGASMGGMIVQELAIHHPTRLLTATSIMSTTGAKRVGHPTPKAAKALLATLPEGRDAVIETALATWKVLSGPLYDAATVAERTAMAFDRGYHPAAGAFHLSAIAASGNRTKALRGVDVPFLVIHGRADPLVDVSGGLATAKAVPDADLLILDDMGHDLPKPLWPQIVGAITNRIERVRAATDRAPETPR